MPEECRTNYIQKPVPPPLSKVPLAEALASVIAGVLSALGLHAYTLKGMLLCQGFPSTDMLYLNRRHNGVWN